MKSILKDSTKARFKIGVKNHEELRSQKSYQSNVRTTSALLAKGTKSSLSFNNSMKEYDSTIKE